MYVLYVEALIYGCDVNCIQDRYVTSSIVNYVTIVNRGFPDEIATGKGQLWIFDSIFRFQMI